MHGLDWEEIRTRYGALIEDARKRKFQAVMVWALDRLSREGALAILSLVQKLSANGVKVLSYQEELIELLEEQLEECCLTKKSMEVKLTKKLCVTLVTLRT